MENNYIIDEKLENKKFTEKEIKNASYEGCIFSGCDFSGIKLAGTKFISCKFTNCNFSLVKIFTTQLAEVIFEDSKLLGINFKDCSTFVFKVNFRNCILDYSSFTGLKMKKTPFYRCSLKGVDFGNCDLSESVFTDCNLEEAIFEGTKLKSADFSSSYGYIIDPEQNYIKNARFSQDGLAGLLRKYGIRIG